MKNDPLRILVAEDSPTARRLLVEILRADPALTVVGEAKDGVEAVELAQRLRPNLVTMDIQMPRMDGLEATRRIMTEVPTPVVVVSTLVERDIQTSMAALRAGALAVLQKPLGPESPDFDTDSRRLRDTLKAMAEVKVVRRWPDRSAPPLAAPAIPKPPVSPTPPGVVALAASTGGPAALFRLLSELPASVPVPLLVVQHIAIGFSQGLAHWLGTAGPLPVKVAEDGEPLLPGHVYLAPDDRHLGVRGEGRAEVSRAAPVNGFRPSATWMFRSVARAYGSASLAVILTGMGQDGLEGVRELHGAGGRILAQDEQSSVVYGMPGVVVGANLAHEVIALPDLAARLSAAFRGNGGV
ncbi:chemotaxis-specific protein-glutamate methyltransferase CheB [Comamonas sp. JC664]|uniref:chemotaxis-specific protein-glutamate methyltransferase CheB n=1 Tax=Comamonas sp. JC664 TaxID=2801917 RepID=UPI00174BC941|nr:chemotaxis-specific protein-glutamate methyltransferase CheB [Comamonas sp. JC664]MBL0698903.1 chemotaxis-specific protein-glutamate methyltransferase CheB [Comamonas sp. JC664]GHG79458.1 chemotaxis response regulator protein-glutamate methylesterase [Comamonas sp. KCTC 72670]